MSYTQIDKRIFSFSDPEIFPDLQNIIQNKSLMAEYAIDEANIKESILWKNKDIFPPFSQAYAGHQFGHFNILWDGRAHMIGEVKYNNQLFDLQLKGSGRTPYSRSGDGKANLSAILREYIMGESMHHLHIPSTRIVWVYTSGEHIARPDDQIWALWVRLAASHIRVGTFQYIAALDDIWLLKKFTDYTIERHFKHLELTSQIYKNFITAVIEKQITTVVNWMRVWFIHGVMNTDNAIISWETLDYGPCAFMNAYNPQKVFSSIDRESRYSYINQLHIIIWNMARFIETLLPLLDTDSQKAMIIWNTLLGQAGRDIKTSYMTMMHTKIWLEIQTKHSLELIENLLFILETNTLDFTNSFLSLQKLLAEDHYSDDTIEILWAWIIDWKNHITDDASSLVLMKTVNPQVIPRNQIVEKIIREIRDWNYTLFEQYMKTIQNMYCEPENKIFTEADLEDLFYKTHCGT